MKYIIIVMMLSLVAFAQGQLVSVTQMGYHPDSVKQAVVYTDASTGSLQIRNAQTGTVVATYSLEKAQDYYGNDVNCQGGNPCLVADFSDFSVQGRYVATAIIGGQQQNSYQFEIAEEIYEDNMPVLIEFFDAKRQQGSTYHADLNSYLDPGFTLMADGSFIMVADQAATTLIRLGSAYKRNPTMFGEEMRSHIIEHVDYLAGLQGLVIQERTDGVGFRLNWNLKISNAFIPGPAHISSLDVYIPGSPPVFLESVPVVSLCGEDDGAGWQDCIDFAEEYYKCQIDEPCLNLTYVEKTGVVTAREGYDVARGWSYEFGCFLDIDVTQRAFHDRQNPCMIFDTTTSREHTAMALLGFLQAIPAAYDQSPQKAAEIFERALNTYQYIKSNYPPFAAYDSDAGFFGASVFLLYDYTRNSAYLQEAHGLRSTISPILISDSTNGNEFYWQEYIRHKEDIIAAGLQYNYNNQAPEEFFRGKIYGDYKDRGQYSISRNAERVYEFDHNIKFQNSRFILTQGLLAAKARDFNAPDERIVQEVADSQLAWITGMNGVQDGVAHSSPLATYSFIIGIGEKYPNDYHSRYQIDTGYRRTSEGEIIGARGTDLMFFDGTSYVYLDGVSTILGQKLGSLGNGYRGEQNIEPFVQTIYNNGRNTIFGWINGAFDSTNDRIFNYHDDVNTYEFTETTNEIVATAVEFLAYQDAIYNNKPAHPGVIVDSNQTTGTLNILTVPGLAEIRLNNALRGTTNQQGNLQITNIVPGSYNVSASKAGYITNSTTIFVNGTANITITLQQAGNQTQNQTQIINYSTSLPILAGGYHMFAGENSSFFVELGSSGTVSWKVDGQTIKSTSGIMHNFNWTPSILYTLPAKQKSVQVTATAGNSSVSWDIDVEYIINPYLEGSSDNVLITVFTNKNHSDFSAVTAYMQHRTGTITQVNLTKTYENSQEAQWRSQFRASPGNNYLIIVEAHDNQTITSFELGTQRAYYVNVPRDDPPTSPSPRIVPSGRPELVYAIFMKDVLSQNDTQTIIVDAKNFRGGVSHVEASIEQPDGQLIKLPLSLVDGNKEYGTWSADFAADLPGEYTLRVVHMRGAGNPVEVQPEGISFYVYGQGEDYELSVIHAVLDKNRVNLGNIVRLAVDARDNVGLTEVNALIRSTSDEEFILPLRLVEGTPTYGTWQATFQVTQPDTTYSVVSLQLSNGQRTRTVSLNERSVYVNPVPGLNPITGSVLSGQQTTLKDVLQKPLVPTLIGFGMMLVIAGIGLLSDKARRR
jgi:hypothetical protein